MNPTAPPLELADDKSVAPVRHDGDVIVRGSLCEGRVVQVGGALSVDGAIEAVTLSAGGAVTVAGGVIGKQKGRYTVGGELRCRFVSGGQIMARGDVRVGSEVVHSRITASGRLDVAGVLYGGDVSANGGVACRVLGHTSGIATVVEAGDGRAWRLLSETIETQIAANRQRVTTVRSSIEPLMLKMKSLSPQQREKATELLYEAGEMEAATAKMVEAFEARKKLSRERARPEIVVGEVVYAGVIARFGPIEAMLSAPIKGPLTLTTRKADAVTEVVIIDGTDGTVCVLPSRASEPTAIAA